MAVEMAQPADGTEKNVTSKDINSEGINYDSDQYVMAATIIKDGKWIFMEGGKVIAEAAAPLEPSAAIVTQWCGEVRARTKRELTMDDLTEREQGRKRKENEAEDHKSDGGIIIPDGADAGDGSRDDAVEGDPPTVSKEEDPDAWILGKITQANKRIKGVRLRVAELEEEISVVNEERQAADSELAKWERLRKAMNAEEE
jgi:hypothetical protein